MTSHPSQPLAPHTEPPLDFALFVAQHRGLQVPDAIRLLGEWVAAYEPRKPLPSVDPHRNS